jgi:hypothetical protein
MIAAQSDMIWPHYLQRRFNILHNAIDIPMPKPDETKHAAVAGQGFKHGSVARELQALPGQSAAQ